MANEYLKRTPTSTGNRKTWTWAAWVKRNGQGTTFGLFGANGGANDTDLWEVFFSSGNNIGMHANSTEWRRTTRLFRGSSSWYHIVIAYDSTLSTASNRYRIFINGKQETAFNTENNPSINTLNGINQIAAHIIGARTANNDFFPGQMSDVFLVDGQALTPEVFGFYKEGNGYISAGSTQATDFRPGQWVPKTPRIIKTEINRRGGFGVNGFYLPMNSSNNFGADFHCTPNSILKLKEDLPQPKAEIDGVGDYTGALRDDPFKDYLVLAIPGVSGGLQNGFGDYSAAIKGYGSAKNVTASGDAGVAVTASYYGSALSFPNNGVITGDDYLTITDNGFAVGTGDFTVEAWINPDSLYNYKTIFSTRPNNGSFTDGFNMWINANGATGVYSNAFLTQSANGAIKVNQWTHVVAERYNGTLTTYINGIASAVQSSNTQNYTRILAGIGQLPSSSVEAFTGQMQDVRFYKGVAKYKGGFDVPKPYTPVGIGTWRAVPDTTANNFATLNPLDTANLVPFNGNLSIDQSSGGWHTLLGTHYVRSGKWYAEMRIDRLGWIFFGIDQTWLETHTRHVGGQTGSKGVGLVYNTASRGDITYNGANSIYTGGDATAATGDIISIALDLDSNNIKFYKNNVLQYNLTNILESGADYAFGVSPYSNVAATVNFGQNPTFSGNITAGTYTDSNGKGLFKYEPPSGFLALCEDNLPTPAIKNPGEYFKTVLWTGVNDTVKIKCGFQPDFVWIKNRDYANWHSLYDSIRGPYLELNSNETSANRDRSVNDGLRSFDSDGFTSGLDDNSGGRPGNSYVAWCWKAGGAATANTDGTITSQVSANQDAGFSIVKWTSNGATSVVATGHGLAKTPKFMLLKRTVAADNWFVYHESIQTNNRQYVRLNTTDSTVTSPNDFWSTSSSTFGIRQSSIATNGQDCIAYCWAEIEGFSKFGSYVGNASADGPFVYCGFKPAWVLFKRTDSGSAENWLIYDSSRSSTNVVGTKLAANLAVIENDASIGTITQNTLDFLSNGFKLRSTNTGTNASTGTYIFAAFAESPFTTANAK